MLTRERQRRSRAKTERDAGVTVSQNERDAMRDACVTDSYSDSDSDISPPTPSTSADENTPPPPDEQPRNRGDGSSKKSNGNPQDHVVEWVRKCIPGTGRAAAAQVVDRCRRQGIGDHVIEEAAGYAAEHGGQSALYVEQVAVDWMTQRDPTWAAVHDDTEPRHVSDGLKQIRR